MAKQLPRDRARELLADSYAAMGSAYSNLAGLIRGGWENFWVKPALDAMCAAMLLSADDDEGDED